MELAGDAAKYPGESSQTDIPPIDGISIVPSFAGMSIERHELGSTTREPSDLFELASVLLEEQRP